MPYRNTKQIFAAQELVKYGGRFSDDAFKSALTTWESATDDSLCTALEQLIGQMVVQGVNYSIFTDSTKSVVDVAVEKKSMHVTRAVLQAQMRAWDGATNMAALKNSLNEITDDKSTRARSNTNFGYTDLDTNNDGTIELSELVSRFGEDTGETLFATLDADHDGKVTQREWMQMITKPFLDLLIQECRGTSNPDFEFQDVEDQLMFAAELASALTTSGEPALHQLLRECGPKAQEFLKLILQRAISGTENNLHCSIDIQVCDAC